MRRTLGWAALVLSAPLAADSEVSPTLVPLASVAPHVVQELRYGGQNNFVGTVVTGYERPRCLLSVPAAVALARVQMRAEGFGLSLKVYDCYRPQRAVNHFVRWAEDLGDTAMKLQFYPEVAKARLFELGYIAERSGHSRGSTVDLTLVRSDGGEGSEKRPGGLSDCRQGMGESGPHASLSMGSGYDCFDPRSHTANPGISPEARANRLLLLLLMESEGFVNYDKEWWHFTLADEPYPEQYLDIPLQ
ncbi:M15 family metallopeptidase [Ferrimonas balearica]|uniref:M15 family metallopeptidase n=1 Tax=Ferrimonas balearica TaxID=44012 RepID=UPI001C98F0E6|nr:M15 family metallopeptidase [Ferrimonas balearica]MBY5991850.1 M15 family metallopeptidase [Ferrimonas balearica]